MANQRGQYGPSKLDPFFLDPKDTGILTPEPREELIAAQARANLAARGIHGATKYQRASDHYEQLLTDEMTKLRGSPTPGPTRDHSPGTALLFLGGVVGLIYAGATIKRKVMFSPKAPKIELPPMRVVVR
jgi:hypothetical protein